ncbi:leucine-rich repeat-containing protein 57 [Sabethes cyaneus]|uniref:leucine-rich repeat-containing protein 57 n=1 Tax=Sabethes cyaneus TaxID=53552 RepID=UPI00221E2DE9|nr:leucine-rich repeat-containing protein 57 [Sabethes cyaneus]XP_053696003.1 leucine-rich repeat-containing protein 57 [Sabethes cyaneus]
MGNKQVKQHFENAQKTGVLKISQMRLNEFPSALKSFPNVLKTLDLSENRFAELPDDIGKFTTLKHLCVSGNRLLSLNDNIGKLVKLETMNASNNLIVKIPNQLDQCSNLKQVLLSNNQIMEFPVMLCGLKYLNLLDLSRNKITIIPDAVSSLQVTELNVNQNQISVISDSISRCPKLKTLRIEENCLQANEAMSHILSDSKICNISVDGNLFSSKDFAALAGYEMYMERYTAARKKIC